MTEVKIGLETHVQLDTDTKLFCGCPNEKDSDPNENICETCLGHPGSKPRLNKKVLDHAVKASQALECDVNEDVFFSRKTYFYPDMSKNFQITQYEVPVGESGSIEVKVGDDQKEIGITRIHIEEDPAKMKHMGGSVSKSDYTKVDYNRAGTPLIEIVTDPDFKSPKEARAYLQQLAQMLEYLDLYQSDSDYSIKSDANISIDGGQRVEVKNITGTSEVEKALNYEISRQKQLAKRGREVEQHTRGFNSGTGATEELRSKETEEDYGYIFDPDLTRQELDEKLRKEIRESLPELPHEKFERFGEEYGLKDKLIESLVTESQLADDFEQLADKFNADLVASWMTGDLKKVLNFNEVTYEELNDKAGDTGFALSVMRDVLEKLESDEISDRNAEKFLRKQVENAISEQNTIEVRNDGSRVIKSTISETLEVSDEASAEAAGEEIEMGVDEDLLKAEDDEISEFVVEAIENNPDAVDDFENGEDGAINFLVGQVMQLSGGKADPKTAREKIKDELE